MLNYEEFTKRNHITKALRMELIPQGKTQNVIDEKGDRKYDAALYSSLERLKPVIDSFIRSTASRALSDVDYDFNAMHDAYINKDKKSWAKEEKALKKVLMKAVDEALPKGLKCSQINSAAFLQEVLREYVLHATDTELRKDVALKDIEETKGCLALFSKFLTTRITALTVWMPERVIENFKIYCSNIPRIEAIFNEAKDIANNYSDELELMKTAQYYTKILSQDAIDGYNLVIAGKITENGIETKGLNVLINEYNIDVKNQKLDKPYLRKINQLYKQTLFSSEKQFVITAIKTDDEVRRVIKSAWESFDGAATKMLGLFKETLEATNGNGVCVKGNRLHILSHALLGEHKAITDNLVKAELVEIHEMLKNEALKPSMRAELEKRVDIAQSLVVKKDYSFTALDEAVTSIDENVIGLSKGAFNLYVAKTEELIKEAKMYYKVLEGGDIFKKRHIKGDKHVQEMLVDFFDALTEVRNIISVISMPDENEDADVSFYNRFDEIYENIRLTYKAENLVRNYITKSVKDTAEEKQTCFGTPARLRTQWWNGEQKFAKNHAAIIKHDGKYYYFILAGDSKPIEIKEDGNSATGLLTLKKGQKSFMMLPKILFTDHAVPFFEGNKDAMEYTLDDESVIRPVKVGRMLYEIYKKGLFKREAVTSGAITEEEYAKNIQALIEKYTEFANAYVQYQKFNLDDINDPTRYSDIGEFFSEVDTCTSRLSWTYIDYAQIANLVDSGSAYLFLISTKFLYTESEDKNAYTKTFRSILSDANMDKTTILLNSNPAVFFRPQSIKKEITHKAGSIMVNKLTEDGEHIPKKIYEAIYKSKNEMSGVSEEDMAAANEYMRTHKVRSFKAKYDKTYRGNYMSDKYTLQLTYTKNNDVSDRVNDMLNDRVIEAMQDGFNIVSVARSTKDMVYALVLDSSLKIIKELSLNVIDGVDYYALLHDTYLEKKENKKLWIYDTENTELKSAYIDLAISEILKLAREYNAVIAVESISDAVKNKYSFIDNQVFKAFENRIAQRLSDLTYKDVVDGRPGSVSNPLQLSNNNGNTYQDGILFFINGAYTRGIDPSSGFTSLFDFSRYNSIASKRQFFSKMAKISYTGDSIVFDFDYVDYPVHVDTEKTKWQVKLSGDVVVYDREKKQNKRIKDVVNEIIIPLAGKTDLNGNIAENILNKDVPGAFVEELFRWFRYAVTGIHAQVKGKDEFYKSPVDGNEYNISNMLAFNLAKKLVFRLEYAGESKDFTKEWLNYMQA
ncbi:type V CRISPR-associated protein Cas12a/Cpf1 [Butyrivibrio hungatei]|nr:type V CRISPR-associated protein Cas12a/Cpf1 [Butyrivibrio hungatei]